MDIRPPAGWGWGCRDRSGWSTSSRSSPKSEKALASRLRNGRERRVIDAIALPVIEASQAGAARRAAVALASRLGFNETERGKVALVVTEIANNLAAHATGGELILRSLTGEPAGMEILALDRGPGMRNM